MVRGDREAAIGGGVLGIDTLLTMMVKVLVSFGQNRPETGWWSWSGW